VVLADEDLNLVLVAVGLEGGRRLARDILAVEEELREGALGIEEGVLIVDNVYKLCYMVELHVTLHSLVYRTSEPSAPIIFNILQQSYITAFIL
jgi:hypothetical protein